MSAQAFNEGCTGKVRHADAGDARKAVTNQRRRGNAKSGIRKMAIYRCQHCGSWHVGGSDT